MNQIVAGTCAGCGAVLRRRKQGSLYCDYCKRESEAAVRLGAAGAELIALKQKRDRLTNEIQRLEALLRNTANEYEYSRQAQKSFKSAWIGLAIAGLLFAGALLTHRGIFFFPGLLLLGGIAVFWVRRGLSPVLTSRHVPVLQDSASIDELRQLREELEAVSNRISGHPED